MNTKYQQINTSGHPCTSNQKSDISFTLLAPANYKEHPYFEKHYSTFGGPNSWAGDGIGLKY